MALTLPQQHPFLLQSKLPYQYTLFIKTNCMKNIFTIALLFLCGTTIQAQLNKGTQLLTGNFNIGASNQEQKYQYDTSINKWFSAGIGVGRQWVHKENRIRGFQIGYDYTNSTQDRPSIPGEYTRRNNSFYVGYVSQYLLPFGKKFYGTATLLSQFAFTKLKVKNENTSDYGVDGESYTLSFGIQPGLAYQISTRWIADVTLGNLIAAHVNHSNSRSISGTTNYSDRSTSFNLSSIFSGNSTFLGIGFRYILR
jgi:hypothetical protein